VETLYLFSYHRGNSRDGLHLAWSEDGLDWLPLRDGGSFLKPEVGAELLMRDPFVLQGPDGVFHMTWTSGIYDQGIGVAHSADLTHWSSQRRMPVMEHEPDARNCWAPEMIYDEAQGHYLIFWSTTIPGRFPGTDTRREPGGEVLNHRIYATTTRDFVNFARPRLLYDPGFNTIDACIVRDGERYLMFLKDETPEPPQKNIRLAVSDLPEGPYGQASAPITGRYWAEGPSAIRIDDAWFVYVDKFREDAYGVVTSVDLEHWEDISERARLPEGACHGTVFRAPRKVVEALRAL